MTSTFYCCKVNSRLKKNSLHSFKNVSGAGLLLPSQLKKSGPQSSPEVFFLLCRVLSLRASYLSTTKKGIHRVRFSFKQKKYEVVLDGSFVAMVALRRINECILLSNRPYSYSQYRTGTSLQWRLMLGNIFESICI